MSEEQNNANQHRLQAVEVLNTMFHYLGIQASVSEEDFRGDSKININTSDAGRLIGRKGQTLEALELVANRILKKSEDATNHLPWLSLDVDGYSVEAPVSEHERHGRLPHSEIERLEALAKDVAKEVKIQKNSRVIGPYSPAERRIIHLALENDPLVETVSDDQADEHRGKKITVKLKNL